MLHHVLARTGMCVISARGVSVITHCILKETFQNIFNNLLKKMNIEKSNISVLLFCILDLPSTITFCSSFKDFHQTLTSSSDTN